MGRELFDNIPSKVSDLLNDVKNGRIGLPDLQCFSVLPLCRNILCSVQTEIKTL